MKGLCFVILLTDLIWHNTGKGNDIEGDGDDGNDDYDGLHKFLRPHFYLVQQVFNFQFITYMQIWGGFSIEISFYVFIECA
jgi:hypothetical protein